MRLCGWTMRVFHTRKPKVLLQVYKSIIRPTLEYASVIWNPTTKGQIRRVERVQRWYTKRLNGLTALTYSERLQVLQLESLESRRCYFDLLQVYQIIGNPEFKAKLFVMQSNVGQFSLRGHELTLHKQRSVTSQRQRFFSNRVIDEWNSLPHPVISLVSQPNAFRAALRNHTFRYSFDV